MKSSQWSIIGFAFFLLLSSLLLHDFMWDQTILLFSLMLVVVYWLCRAEVEADPSLMVKLDLKTKFILFLSFFRILFAFWMGGWVPVVEIPLTTILVYGVWRNTWWGFLYSGIIFAFLAFLFFASLVLTQIKPYSPTQYPYITAEQLFIVKLFFGFASISYGLGASFSLFLFKKLKPVEASTRKGEYTRVKGHKFIKLFCWLIGVGFLRVQEVNVRGHTINAVIFEPKRKHKPFHEPLTGYVFLPSKIIEGEMKRLNEIIILHEIGHLKQPISFNFPRDVSKYVQFALFFLVVLSLFLAFLEYSLSSPSNLFFILFSIQLFLFSFLIRILCAPLNWVCEAHAEAYAVKTVGLRQYSESSGEFKRSEPTIKESIRWLNHLFERLPSDIQLKFILNFRLNESY